MLSLPIQLAAFSLGISALSSILIFIVFARSASKSTKRNDIAAVQASHLTPTPRIGGLAIVIALTAVGFISMGSNNWTNYSLLILSALPVFSVGLAEDLGFSASPRRRLFATGVSGAVFIALLGQWLLKTDIPGLDIIMQWAPFAIAFSVFLAVGISHAFNLIDGLNGLAGLTGIGASLALASIAHQESLTEHRDILIIIGAAIAGFLTLNFPFGKIFLGDAGAYLIGHLLAWMSVSILWNAPNVTPFAMLLIFFWPVADTVLAITRRMSSGKPVAQPDRLHFHQLAMRGVEIVLLGRKKRRIANPIATLFTVPFIFSSMIAGVFLALDRSKAAIACVVFTTIFIAIYKTGMWMAPKLRRSVRPKRH